MAETPATRSIVAGTGTYDTRHTVELTERAHEAGVDAMLVVTPYYVKPNRRGLRAHYEAVAAATDRPIILYNIPEPYGARHAERPARRARRDRQRRRRSSRPATRTSRRSTGLDLLAGNDDVLARVLDMGGTGGILVASHLVGREMRRMIDEPDARARDPRVAAATSTRRSTVTTNPIPIKAALNLAGHDVGGLRLPLVEADEQETAAIRGRPRAPQPAGGSLSPATLRVLPLGGLGEIGKNMMVVEYDGRIVVVDTGLMFPAPDQLGIDLVLPDFTYLRERAEDIEAIVLTHGHEDHVGALPFVLRELDRTPPDLRRPADGRDGALEARRAPAEGRRRSRTCSPRQTFEAGPFSIEMVKMAHSIPDAFAVALTCELGTTLVTGDYKFDQTPVDGVPADVSRLAELGREGLLLLCGDSTNADRPGRVAVRVRASGRGSRRSSRAARGASSSPASPPTSTACSRWWTRPRSSGARSRWSAARCART